MAGPIVDITLGNSTTGTASPLSGSFDIDTASGSLTSAALNLDVLGQEVPLVDLSSSVDPATGITTVTGNTLATGLGTGVTLAFSGTMPATVTTTVSALGAQVVSNTLAVTTVAVCFVSGTSILTTKGEVAVENLCVGDLAVTASGKSRPIRWLGRRTIDCRNHFRPHEVMPVCIAAHSFGEHRPARDLLVSPGHSICVDIVGEVLIPAMALINGTTIVQKEVDHVTYWHVELDSHDILVAENMPAESYLEMGNRAFFAGGDVVALDASPDAPAATHADFCRPFHSEGALVEVVRAQLSARAPMLGWQLVDQGLGDLHLVVDGMRIDPHVRGLAARFTVPANAENVWLVSGASIPSAISASSDTRLLGVCLNKLAIDDGFDAPLAVMLDDPRLCVGFHAVERKGESTMRWTAGRALLPASLWEGARSDFFLRVDLTYPALPRWVAPSPSSRADNVVVLAA